MKVYGKNVFNELKENYQKIRRVYLSNTFKDKEIIDFIKSHKISYEIIEAAKIKQMGGNNQGIIMLIDDYDYVPVESFYQENIVLMLDHLEDPHNLGAIIRTCEAAGIKSIIIPKDRSVTINETVYKTSSGALANVNIALVNNLNKTINDFKNKGFFVYGTAMDGTNYKKVDYASKVLLVIGNEGKGMSRLIKENCDEIIAIPMQGKVNSLNASVAAGIVIFDLVNR